MKNFTQLNECGMFGQVACSVANNHILAYVMIKKKKKIAKRQQWQVLSFHVAESEMLLAKIAEVKRGTVKI